MSGGFAFTDAEKTEVSALEAVKLEDIDEAKVRAEYAAASKGDDDDSKAAADAAKAMAAAIGVHALKVLAGLRPARNSACGAPDAQTHAHPDRRAQSARSATRKPTSSNIATALRRLPSPASGSFRRRRRSIFLADLALLVAERFRVASRRFSFASKTAITRNVSAWASRISFISFLNALASELFVSISTMSRSRSSYVSLAARGKYFWMRARTRATSSASNATFFARPLSAVACAYHVIQIPNGRP